MHYGQKGHLWDYASVDYSGQHQGSWDTAGEMT